jgi:transcriptional regulator with XRE-family HTH domain
MITGGDTMEEANAGERIRLLRELNNYTREAFAEKVDISAKFLYEIEIGKKGFSANTLCRISQALSVSCDYIMYGENRGDLYLDNVVGVLNKFDNKQMGRLFDILSSIYSLSSDK